MSDLEDSGLSMSVANPIHAEEAESTISQHSSPVVFQCSLCNTVLGDSTAWVSANSIMRTITLACVTGKVCVKPDSEVSKNGVDKDSTYRTLYCMNCNEELGKQYLASSPDLDHLRGSFTFLVEKLNSYEVGSAEVGGQTDLADMLTIPSGWKIQQHLKKLQCFTVSMDARIKALESAALQEGQDLSNNAIGNPQQILRENNKDEMESVSSSENATDINEVHQMLNTKDRNRARENRLSDFKGKSGEENRPLEHRGNQALSRKGMASHDHKTNGTNGVRGIRSRYSEENMMRWQHEEKSKETSSRNSIGTYRSIIGNNNNRDVDENGHVESADIAYSPSVRSKRDTNSPSVARTGAGRFNQYSSRNMEGGYRGHTRYVQRTAATVEPDDLTDNSVCGRSEMDMDDGQKSSASLMEQWPSPKNQKMQSNRKRKLPLDK